MEATTLVLQSDLDIIVKASRNEVFVFAQNMVTQTPWADARVLITDGQRIFAETATGKDGVFHATYDHLSHINDVRVLAIADGHVASNVVGLEGVGVAQGLADKGYIYTDRPAYRAGHRVHVHGCIRQVANSRYIVPASKALQLEVLDPRQRLVWQAKVTLDDFGAFGLSFLLPSTSPQGEYHIQVHDESKRLYQGTFRVHEFKLEPIQLTVDVERRVYYRGETIEGTIRARYDYGAPLAGREITYQLTNDRSYTATTNEHGEVRFALPTIEFYENQILSLIVKLPEREVQTQFNFYLATQGFAIQLGTHRDVMVAGETFELNIETKDAAGKPTQQTLNLKVLKLTTVDGKVGDHLVEEYEVQTADEDATARKSLTLDTGGRYRLRAEGQDRWGNPVSGQIDLLVSDDEDRVRLRILADQHTYKVGDDAEVTLHWRDKPALALVTFQADRVLNYRLVQLQTGVNKLPIIMDTRLVPNFQLEAAVMVDARPAPRNADAKKQTTDTVQPLRFHTASSSFTVVRDLLVSLSLRREDEKDGPAKPGEKVEVTVTTTDPQGNPVAAKVSLAMVEQSLLRRFPRSLPEINEFFQAGRREVAVRTSSSINFAYRPRTSFVNPQLLAEKDRIELAHQEAASRERAFTVSTMGKTAVVEEKEGTGGDINDPFGGAPRPNDVLSAAFRSEGGYPGGLPVDPSVVISQIQEVQSPEVTSEAAAGAKDGMPEAFWDPTAYWNSSIITDKKGRAAVVVQLPTRSAAWTLRAKGITKDTLAGETIDTLVAEKELFGRLKLPLAFVDGDQAEVIAQVHNHLVTEGSVGVTLSVTIAGRTVEQKKKIDVTSKGVVEVPFKVSLDRPDDPTKEAAAAIEPLVTFRLTVAAGDARDALQRKVPLKPDGITAFATAGGWAEANSAAWVEPPKAISLHRPHLQIRVGSSVEMSLLDMVLVPAPGIQTERFGIVSSADTLSSQLMASLALQKLLGQSLDSGGRYAQHSDSLSRYVPITIASLISQQEKDGGWGWSVGGRRSDRYASARAVWALSLARRAGHLVPDDCHAKATQYLASQVAATAGNDLESKAILLHALYQAGRGDFPLANRLYRERPSLSNSALLYLALTFVEMDRKETAGELLALVDRRWDERRKPADQEVTAPLAGSQSLTETRATLRPGDSSRLTRVIQGKRTGRLASGSPKRPPLGIRQGNGTCCVVLCEWFAKSRFEGSRYKLSVWVNDHQTSVLDMDGAAGTQVIDVPAEQLVEGKQRVRFEMEGRGRYTYQAVLAGFVPSEDLKDTTDGWKVDRVYTPAPLEREGREIPRGFANVAGGTERFHNPLSQLPIARRALVDLQIKRNVDLTGPNERLEYLVVTEPIPSGARVIEHAVHGSFERFEIGPGAIRFYVGARRNIGLIHYELSGYLPGEYHAGATVVRNAYRPEQMAVAKSHRLTILPKGELSQDPYRLTPQELYELGNLALQRGDWQRAESLLTELIAKWSLNAVSYRQTVETLLDVSLELNKPSQIVRYFEIVSEKWPEKQIPFATVLRIGSAYEAVGEFERSYLVYRAATEGTFTRESGVAGVLANQGELLRSVSLMQQLIGEYPPEPYVAAAHYSLAQQVYAKAPDAAADQTLQNANVNRIDLIAAAWRMLESFLTEYSLDPAADQAAFLGS